MLHINRKGKSSISEPAKLMTMLDEQEGSLEKFLEEGLGIAAADVDTLVQKAIVWRITPGGRSLLDRRRRSRVERNVYGIVDHLADECHLPTGGAPIIRSLL